MGACASCLGLGRHSSKHLNETDPLLDDSQVIGYGSTAPQPDEEELQRERDALDKITNEATENMIDVVHPHMGDSSHHAFTQTGTQRSGHSDSSGQGSAEAEEEGEDEANWWQNIQSAGIDKVGAVKGLNSNALVLDIQQLKEEPSKLATKPSSKGHLAL